MSTKPVRYSGDTWAFPFTWTLKTTGVPIDLTGYTVTGELKSALGGSVLATQAGTITDAANGAGIVTFAKTATALVPEGDAYLLLHFDSGSNRTTVAAAIQVVTP